MTRAALVLATLASTAARLPAQERHEFAQVHMGMPVRIVLYATDADAAREAARHAFARIAQLDDALSDFRPSSELRRLEARPGEWVAVGPELFAVLESALAVARASGGAFDPTIGPVVALWRRARERGRLPDPSAIDAARARTGWEKVQLDRERRAVRLAAPGMRLDLGGVAKGFVLQEALAALRERGAGRALVEAGGDIVAGDAPPRRQGWHIDTPFADEATARRAGSLANAAVATSGPSAQFVVVNGVRYSHVVDPRTGVGLADSLVATVIAGDAALADALATALTVVGTDGATALLERFPSAVASIRAAPR